MFYKQTPVKITGNGLAAGSQVFCRKIYGFFNSVPRKSVVRLTDHPELTVDIYRGRKTTIQHKECAICVSAGNYAAGAGGGTYLSDHRVIYTPCATGFGSAHDLKWRHRWNTHMEYKYLRHSLRLTVLLCSVNLCDKLCQLPVFLCSISTV